ncbi:MAG: DNA primase [Bacilli bacterium]|nr:DNA primase [Bacilli bacterium]
MEKLSTDTINLIREKSDIVEIISSYIPLTPRGKNYFGVCPFHDDNHPSMSVSKEKQIYKCFSCGATGNVFTFVSEYENISFIEAVQMLADKAGIPIQGNYQKTKPKEDPVLYEIYELSSKFYQNNVNTKEGREAREYLKQRQIDEQVIKEFGIGLSLKDNKMLSKLLVSKGYSDKNLEKCALLVKRDYQYSDLYYNRVMFPLWNLSGQVVGFSGRIYNSEDPSKYINSRETEIFKKGELLYNYHRAKIEARKKGTIIVMEGFMDVIRAYTIGITNVVATMGTAVTKGQAQLLKKMARDIILCFDGDEAGAKATFACADILLEMGVTPKIVRLENNMDPDDFIKKNGKESFLSRLDNPITIMDFKLNYLKKDKDLTSTDDMAKYVSAMLEELSRIEDVVVRELTLKKMSEESKLDFTFLKDQLTDKLKEVVPKEILLPKKVSTKKNRYQMAEQNLLYYMLCDTEVIKIYMQEKPFLPRDTSRMLALEIVHYYKENSKIELADIISLVSEQKEVATLLQEILLLPLNDIYKKEEILDYCKVIRDYNVNYEMNRLKKKLTEETNIEEKTKIAEQIVQLKKGELI